jgi:hypothetical protein
LLLISSRFVPVNPNSGLINNRIVNAFLQTGFRQPCITPVQNQICSQPHKNSICEPGILPNSKLSGKSGAINSPNNKTDQLARRNRLIPGRSPKKQKVFQHWDDRGSDGSSGFDK